MVGEKRLDDDAFSPGQGGSGISLTFTKVRWFLPACLTPETCPAASRIIQNRKSHGRGVARWIAWDQVHCHVAVSMPNCTPLTFRLGCHHLPPESVEVDNSPEATPLQQFHQSILNDIPKGHWGWSESAAEEGSWDSKLGMESKSRGIDPGTVYFEPDDVVLLVDCEL